MRTRLTMEKIQIVIVSICFLGVCLATQQIQTKAWNSGLIEFSRNATGVLMAVVIMTNYKWSDLRECKMPYIVWTMMGGLAIVIGIPVAIKFRRDYLVADTIVVSFGILLMGYCVIHTVISLFRDKYRPRFYKPLFVPWLLMMVWMVFSESEYLWPECYLILFMCYYFTEQTLEQRKNVIKGMTIGMILGFLIIQGHSFLCRPYDRVNYFGNFCNSNHNAMFLCMCLVAIWGNILVGVQEKRQKWKQIPLFLLAAVCYSLVFMTGCRSGYLAVCVATFFFLLGYCKVKKKGIFVRTGILLIALFIAIMPLTYLVVRYVPTIHPHVVFYFQEGYSEKRVHSWDPRDSEKYISFDEMLEYLLGRFSTFFESVDNFNNVVEVEKYSCTNIVSSIDYIPRGILTYGVSGAAEWQSSEAVPALDIALERENQVLVRYTIYKWYYDHLTLRGMPYDEQGFQLTKDHWIQDTHNIYLDYGINFGWPAMIMFTIFIWWGIGRLTVRGMKMRDAETLTCLLICLVPPIFGLFEYSWGPGMISTVAFYLAFKEMFSMDGTKSVVQAGLTSEAVALETVEVTVETVSEGSMEDLEFLEL